MSRVVFCIFGVLLLSGCGGNSTDDFYRASEKLCSELTTQLKEIDRYEDLLEKQGILEKKFQKLVDLMILAKAANKKSGKIPQKGVHAARLQEELMRVYQIEGAFEMIERAQKEALIRLSKNQSKHQMKSAFFQKSHDQ